MRSRLLLLSFLVTVVLTLVQASAVVGARRQVTGVLVYYEGGSGGGTIGLLRNGRIQRVSYSEPIQWTGLKSLEDVWYGAEWTIEFGLGRRSNQVVAINNSGRVNQDVRAVWQLVVDYYTLLSKREYVKAHDLLGSPLRGTVGAQQLREANESRQFEIKPFDRVQPNPLSRYGILSYGMKIIRWSVREAIVFVRAGQFVSDDQRLYAMTVIKAGSGYRIVGMKEIDADQYYPGREIRKIRTAKDWHNPYVMVHPDGFELILHDGARAVEILHLSELEKALADLPSEQWPLGQVVAVQEIGLRSPGDSEKIAQKLDELKRMLRSHRVRVELWPTG